MHISIGLFTTVLLSSAAIAQSTSRLYQRDMNTIDLRLENRGIHRRCVGSSCGSGNLRRRGFCSSCFGKGKAEKRKPQSSSAGHLPPTVGSIDSSLLFNPPPGSTYQAQFAKGRRQRKPEKMQDSPGSGSPGHLPPTVGSIDSSLLFNPPPGSTFQGQFANGRWQRKPEKAQDSPGHSHQNEPPAGGH